MSDIELTIYLDELVEGTEEFELVQSVTSGNLKFHMLGCSYAVTDVRNDRFSWAGRSILSVNRDKITIKAMKMIHVNQPSDNEVKGSAVEGLPALGSKWIHQDSHKKVKVIHQDKESGGVVIENISGFVSGIWNDSDYLLCNASDLVQPSDI